MRDDIRLLQRAAMESIQGNIHSVESPEFLRFRRALDDDSPDDGEEWERDVCSRDDPFGPKWERQRVVATPMI